MQTAVADTQKLWEQGYTYIDVDESLVDSVKRGFKTFVGLREKRDDYVNWGLTRSGEGEIDRGLWAREGGSKDIKSVFHFDPALEVDLQDHNVLFTDPDRAFFVVANNLYHKLFMSASELLAECDAQYGTDMQMPFLDSASSTPYATTILRNLWYPAVAGQKGAKPHLDRGLLTMHLGDEGGHLLALTDKNDPNGERVSPPPGKALVFWGVKALWATQGRIGPLWHSSVTEADQERFALVQFNHIALPDYVVRDAAQAYVDYQN